MLKLVICKSLFNRKRQLTVATVAVVVAATLIATLANLALGMKTRLSRELEAYGANIILVPEAMSLPAGTGRLAFGEIVAEQYLAERNLEALAAIPPDEVKTYVPYLYNVATYQEQKVIVAGTLFDRLKELVSYWQIEGVWTSNDETSGAIIGKKVAQKFALRPGDALSLNFGTRSQDFRVTGIAEVGGSEDNYVFVGLKTAQGLSGRLGQVDLVQIRASAESRPLAEVAALLKERLTGVEVRVVGQIASAEEAVLFKIELLMALITALVLVGSAVAVFSTLTASVLERKKEIGLMKAIGARNRWIALVFLAEAWTIGLAGGLLGAVLGLGMAQAIARSVFDAYLSPQMWAIPATLAAALVVTTLAATGPVHNAVSIEPIITLRGE